MDAELGINLGALSILAASLLGSPHCAGMCGGFVAFYSANAGNKPQAHLGYHIGRLLTYTILGAVAGGLGAVLDRAGSLAGFQRVTLVVTGALMIVWGIAELTGLNLTKRLKLFSLLLKLEKAIYAPLLKSRAATPNWSLRAFLIGAASTFLPCGWLYTFVALAAASASIWHGAGVMLLFWVGTVPILLGMGAALAAAGTKLRAYVPRFTAIFLIAAGLFALSGRYQMLFPPAFTAAPACHQHR